VKPAEAAPLLAPEHASRLLDDVIYEQLAGLVDFDGIWQLEQILAMSMCDMDSVSEDEMVELSKGLIDRAWHKLADDPRRYARFSSEPFGECELCEEEGALNGARR